MADYLATQFPDLTELTHFHHVLDINKYMTLCSTEFLFYVEAYRTNAESFDSPENYGFKALAKMNNWWPSHRGETRPLTLWWKRMPQPLPKPVTVYRKRWSFYGDAKVYKRHEPHMAVSGCGFKIGELPLRTRLFHRYFTLMRLPLIINKIKETWLINHNYRLIDKGELAQYWLNGWPVDTYSPEVEYKYFKTSPKEWEIKGETLAY